jgi:hypothetical protein
MAETKMGTPYFWICVLADGVVRVDGGVIQEALKAGRLSNKDFFFAAGTSLREIVQYLGRRGVKLYRAE